MWKLETNGDLKYFIEGPGRLTSALETTLSSSPKLTENQTKEKIPPAQKSNHVMACRTIVASDNDVSNGFVKDGKALPYVFEATESGLRKRSNKILPVCGVCGKKFVCVTTMKRHLVTHTGEKPFSCKVCGKQYTQKGNLRVHERTHRNDRPFECNICHQKFYRKEPMQKHQWRQHAIVHFKSRPTNPKEESEAIDLPTANPPSTEEALPPLREGSNSSSSGSSPILLHRTSETQKPCLKHKMKLAQAYLREQRELGESISPPSGGKDIVGLLNLSLKEEALSAAYECDGCSRTFDEPSALSAHIGDSVYKCCQCSAEFTQVSLLRQHQRSIHGASEGGKAVLPKPAMTFTMQELIERGVEKSMMQRADIGRFDDEGSSEQEGIINLSFHSPPSPPSQPLDLSPGKGPEDILASRASNPLLNNQPYKEIQGSSGSSLSPVYKKQRTSDAVEPTPVDKQPIKLQSWKDISPYIKSDFVRSSERFNNMDSRNRPQDGRTV